MTTPEPLPSQPRADGELVFTAPWQARTFAMAVHLHAAGVFAWNEWSTRLAANIAEFERDRAIEDGDAYYRLWQRTLEEIVEEKT
ncbi:MAG: nitrile hydratase accessory protein [bacterium]